MGRVRLAVVLVTVAGLAACASGSSKSAPGPLPPTSISTTTSAPGATGPRIIIDTDLSRWWDDATAIGLANVLHEQGVLDLVGIVSDIPNPVAVAAIDAI